MSWAPQQRQTMAHILTSVGWVAGKMHVPAKAWLLDHLNHSKGFLPLTGVTFEEARAPLPFFAVSRDQIILMFAQDEYLQHTVGVEETVLHTLSCLLERGNLVGKVKILRGVRVSDFFAHQAGFVHFQDCDLLISDRWGRSVIQDRRPTVLVNVKHMIGVTEGGIEEPAAQTPKEGRRA